MTSVDKGVSIAAADGVNSAANSGGIPLLEQSEETSGVPAPAPMADDGSHTSVKLAAGEQSRYLSWRRGPPEIRRKN